MKFLDKLLWLIGTTIQVVVILLLIVFVGSLLILVIWFLWSAGPIFAGLFLSPIILVLIIVFAGRKK